MPAISPPASPVARLWSTRLWLLSAALGTMAVYTGAATIHDGNQQRLAIGLVTQATAMHLSTLAGARLERLALEGFAPAGPLAANASESSASRATIELLARRQRDGLTCACRDVLPVSAFFRFDVASNALSVVPVDSAKLPDDSSPSANIVTELALAESRAPRRASNAASHLVADARLGDESLVTLVQRDDPGTPVAVFGMVVNTRETLAELFDRSPEHSPIDSAGLTRLDSLSLEIRSASGERIFGALGSGRAHAVALLGGPLRGLQLTIALSPSGVAQPLLAPHSQLRLWNLGALLAATVIVLALAVSASHRELLLARARSDFIAGVSHDLRMPLAQILIASETLSLQRERTDAERVSLASSIVRETRRLVGLVDNVLLFSRSGALELTPAMRPVAVDELFDEVTDAVKLAVDDAEQTIEVAPAPAVAIMGDRRLVRQALVNLVDNALKYGKPGQRIRLGADQRGETVCLHVDDEGPGIPKAERDRIFEPYARLAHDQVSERTGTGLGLGVVRQIAKACKGRVWVEDAPGRGARIVLELRAAAAAPAPVESTPAVVHEA